ncbi:hypothetical protein A3J20_02995 [Candidatus Gottesmanbacteria bacterium RIFCSPLOWO2_02_FULL_42_29]|uniref:DUF2029 domain-containing protein n=2 Tax=Candidatus Gottesmaniibacteriota TaxID=1752720 RepID=A0A1F6B7L6_9BACT|nr:MAG: hypothetical protein UV09_C0003G0055 [Candidatus Gottesmanbacteria bacterium GW2011_GWA2_42_18]OGG10833.1 MAG: hypothetical protein A2781_01890 [Candidatus Gottesmanbacteria bacterium RIFCSPHIGHO2_01_FULL_42_27]OGG19503.1 MAG: hypothetical protein A3E72_06980 [Candidatus Gottesmanbacteria bacterium RIFCSPHIGHO2_12_FULL_43_26]OGG32926.1 MAG: hypothetical protein A2968_06680 [Candidatus Gottesmanbacteria bacterium RIFCSPLOWO2_01_FULL_42_22]OGG36039.1 MAG: hypothetical protein A3G68_04825 
MLNPTNANFYIFLGWCLILLLVNYLSFIFLPDIKTSGRNLILLSTISIFVRFLIIAVFPFAVGYDVKAFLWAAEKIKNGQDIYWSLNVREYYAFLPTFGMITALFLKLSRLDPVVFFKLSASVFDSLIPLIIAKVSRNLKGGLLYALSPISVISSISGQFDAIPLFFTMSSLYLANQNSLPFSALLLGIGVAFKPWPLIFTPLILFKAPNRREGEKLLVLALTVPLAVSLFYKLLIPASNLATMVLAIILYESSIGWWGPSVIFFHLAQITYHRKILTVPAFFSKIFTLGILFFIFSRFKNKNIFLTTQWLILALYLFSFGLSIHYFVWILPLILINKTVLKKEFFLAVGLFTILNSAYIFNFHYQPPALPLWLKDTSSVLLWIFMAYWAIRNFRFQKPLNRLL